MTSSSSSSTTPLVNPLSSTLFRPIPDSHIWRPLLTQSSSSPSHALTPSPSLSRSSSSSSVSIPPTTLLHLSLPPLDSNPQLNPQPQLHFHPPPHLPNTSTPASPTPPQNPPSANSPNATPLAPPLPDRILYPPNPPPPLSHFPSAPSTIFTPRRTSSARRFPPLTTATATATATDALFASYPHAVDVSSPHLFPVGTAPTAHLNKPNFFTRVLRRLRTSRLRDRQRPAVRPATALTHAHAPPLAAEVSPHVHTAESFKEGEEGDDDDWSLDDLRLYTGVKRECGSFSVVDTEGKRRAAANWGMMGRRRSMNLGGMEEGGGMLRVCRTSVSLVRDKERKKRLGRREDRRVEIGGDRSDVVCRRKKWKSHGCGRKDDMVREYRGSAVGGGSCEVHSRCNSDPVMFRCGKSFQSSNSSAALSVSTVTQASHSSN